MTEPQQAMPVFHDLLFRKKGRKGEPGKSLPAPVLEGAVADTHAHVDMLAQPALALARAGALGVNFICAMTDPAEGATAVYDSVEHWCAEARDLLSVIGAPAGATVPDVRLSCGVHPHNAKHFDADMHSCLVSLLARESCCILGEIGLDYHYDLSPRDVQRDVFARQIEIAHETGLPISLHMREAHEDGLAILREVGFPQAGTVLHCFNLGPDDVRPWLDEGCFIAIGGPVTFGSCDTLRDAMPLVPVDRLLTETDCPYMTPAPMRGMECEPAHTLFTAAKLAEVRGVEPGEPRKRFLSVLHSNALSLLNREATPWQIAQSS